MAEQIISPGVFTRENDLSFLPQGVGQIGAAIIGPTEKGPAFVPTVVRSFSEFERRFGPLSKNTFVPQTAREYLKNAGSVTICRVLAGGGYTFTGGTNEPVALAVSGSSGNVVLGIIWPSKSTNVNPTLQDTEFLGSGSGTAIENFNIFLKGDNVTNTTISASINPTNANYLFKQIGRNPNNSKIGVVDYTGGSTNGFPGYTYQNWKSLQTDIVGATTAEVSTITIPSDLGIITSSLQDTALIASGAFFLTDADGNQNTVFFNNDTAGLTTLVASDELGNSGSLVAATVNSEAGAAHVSASTIAISLATAIDGLGGFTATASSTNVVTVTAAESGGTLDISTSFGSSTASLATTTQGADVTGYKGVNSSRQLILLSQDDTKNVAYKGGPGLTTTTEGYGYATTPTIVSQFLNDTKATQDLFSVHTLDHGKHLCHEYKVSIANLREPADIDGVEQYSQFSLILRRFNDTDKSPVILEQYNNLTLDPDSVNYISRRIGDRYPQYNENLGKVELLGNYPNISNYIRIEVASAVGEKSISPKLSPKGFAALYNPFPGASFTPTAVIPSASFESVQTLTDSSVTPINYSTKGYLGFKFLEKDADNENFMEPIPTTLENNVAGAFNVENHFGHPSSSLWSGSLSASISTNPNTGPLASQLKFSVPFQGGDDGIAPWIVKFTGAESTLAANYTNATAGTANLFGFDVSGTTAAGYTGYKKAIDILSNQDEYDINMLALPGVIKSIHSSITNAAIDMVEERGDCFYVMDLSIATSTINQTVQDADGLDTNYAAVYYPWVKVLDSAQNKPILVPPSVIVPGAIAASDAIAAEWFAPAGLNRGILGNVLEAKIRLNQAERDTLYDAKINPIATFPQTGVCIWGQKTLQERSTALNRINVRRLLIALKKFIASSSRYLVFEQNTIATRNRFLNIVNPYLESVQQRQGLFAFRVQMDEGNNTPEVIDRNQLVGAIFLQPTKTAEFIILDFNVLPTGATFDTGGGGAGGGGAAGGGGGGGGGY